MKKTLFLTTIFLIGITAQTSFGQAANNKTVMPDTKLQDSQPIVDNSGFFEKRRYSITGKWTIETLEGQTHISFNEAFKTKGGPDLKVFLSPNSLQELSSTSAESGALKLGVLKSNRGKQSYILPDDISLSDYKSLIIHCEAFSVLWGGFNLKT